MISDIEAGIYRDQIIRQLEIFKKLDVDPYSHEDAYQYQKMIAFSEGQLFAINKIIGGYDKPVKCISFDMYGASDDLIELEGDIRDEIGAFDVVRKFYLSDGTCGTIEYTEEGVWRISVLETGTAKVNIIKPTQSEIDEDTNYTDKATFIGNIEWIVFDDGTIVKPR